MRDSGSIVFGWKLSSLNADIASVRYRALIPLISLGNSGVVNKIFSSDSEKNLDYINLLIIVKSFDVKDILLSRLAFEKNIPVIFDLCDNIFFDEYGTNATLSPKDVLLEIYKVASAIVTTNEALADLVREKLGDKVPVYVVPDGIETESLSKTAYRVIEEACAHERRRPLMAKIRNSKRLLELLELVRTASLRGFINLLLKFAYRRFEPLRARILRRPSRVQPIRNSERLLKLVGLVRTASLRGFINLLLKFAYRSFEPLRARILRGPSRVVPEALPPLSNNVRRLLWFGNHGAQHGGRFGYIDLVDNRDALERIANEFDVELVVVSNHEKKFEELIAPLRIRSRYVDWSPARLWEELARADVVLVPNSCDFFSAVKSANRTVLALMANRPVVATLTESLQPLSGCVAVGDFYAGIRRYLTDKTLVDEHLKIAREICQRLYGEEAIANAWLEVFHRVKTNERPKQVAVSEIVYVVNSFQDIDFICPIVAAAKNRGVAAAIWVSKSTIRRWPYTLAALLQSGGEVRLIEEVREGAVVPRFASSVRAVLTIADTNLGPHRFSRSITQAANKAGINTGTLQHGFENVGLTYSDDLHVIERIEFEARHIFVWGSLSLLHPRVSEKTRRKCIVVGCPKMAVTAGAALPPVVPAGKPVVGIYENLHWHRYDNAYRRFFLDGAFRLAAKYPDVTFIIKPHNAGLWLTTRFEGELEPPANLLIADPSEHQWKACTTTSMLPHLSGVITSPSTVPLDAARAGLPVAVVAHGLALNNYAPLYRIEDVEQWADFAASLFDSPRRQSLVDASHAFVARVLLSGDAATRIVEHLLDPNQTYEA